jgi:hypothetical protein
MEKTLLLKKRSSTTNLIFKVILTASALICFLTSKDLHAQSAKQDSAKIQGSLSPTTVAPKTYPRTVGYLSFIVPVVTINHEATTFNFNGTTSIGFPVGVNVLYSDSFGFSYKVYKY